MEKQLQSLTEMSSEVKTLEKKLKKKREERNQLALKLVEEKKYSLRKIAAHAGVANPYLIQLRNKLNG